MQRQSHTQAGFGAYLPIGDTAEMGNLGGIFPLLAGGFSIIIPINFVQSTKRNYFLNADDGVNRHLRLCLNENDDKNGAISFIASDSAGNVRTVEWDAQIAASKINWLKIVSSGAGDGDLNLYLEGADVVDIISETHDVDFEPDTLIEFIFGDVGLDIEAFQVYGPVLTYDRALSSDELIGIEKGIFPEDHLINFPLNFPNIGLQEPLT